MEMKQQVLLVAAYWLTTYSTFSALVSILHSITKYPHHPAALDSYQNAIEGESALVYLAKNEASLQASALALFSYAVKEPASHESMIISLLDYTRQVA
jgi:hypothetical protein